jgi:hypothetical protein
MLCSSARPDGALLLLLSLGSLALGTAPLGCTLELTDEVPQRTESVTVSRSALSSFVTFTDCTSRQRNKIEEAAEIVLRQVNGSDRGKLLECLKQASLSLDLGASPESILEALREDLPTHVTCERVEGHGASGYAPAQTATTERMTLDYDFINENDAAGIAPVFIHELGHNKGFMHPDRVGDPHEYRYTVNEQLEACSRSLLSGNVLYDRAGIIPRPNGAARSDTRTRLELATVGSVSPTMRHTQGYYGNEYGPVNCGFDDSERPLPAFVKGFSVELDGSEENTTLRSLSVACSKHDGRGATWEKTVAPSVGRTRYARTCPAGSLLIGFRGRVERVNQARGKLGIEGGEVIRSLTPLCQALPLWSDAMSPVFPIGAPGATDNFERVCPKGMAVNSVSAFRTEGYGLQTLTLHCQSLQDIRESRIILQDVLSGESNWGLARSLELCPIDGALVSLFGQGTDAVNRLGARCRSVFRETVSPSLVLGDYAALRGQGPLAKKGRFKDPADAIASWDPEPECKQDEALVGLSVRVAEDPTPYVSAVRGVCAKLKTWAAGDSATRLLPRVGGTAGTWKTVKCSYRRLLAGWEIGVSAGRVAHLKLACKSFGSEPLAIDLRPFTPSTNPAAWFF